MEQNPAQSPGLEAIENWYAFRQWQPFAFQRECWERYLRAESGILNAPTGSGKTYALWMGCLASYINQHPETWQEPKKNGLRVLWITPLRALSKDIRRAMQEACDELGMPWQIAQRTGDTSTSERQKQQRNAPECLITTPESLHLMLAQKKYPTFFKNLEAVIVDEWHELIGTKRGVQIELGISKLRTLCPALRVWGISATIGNLQQAGEVLLNRVSAIVRAKVKKKIAVRSILPDEVEKFPWAGHLGTKLIKKILPIIEQSQSTLLFTNTRAQAEIWYQKMMEQVPELAGLVALHHGSLDREVREWVEDALHQGKLKLVICTSSLDLGVDFRPVETVIQVGGPKGVARFLQRAGRSGHRPEAQSIIYFLPTNSLELIEGAALKQAAREVTEADNLHHLEGRPPIEKPLDVLVQYLVTLAVSEGFDQKMLYPEIKNTYAFRNLSTAEWEWALAFITTGGGSLDAYQEYSKVQREGDFFQVTSRRVAMRHRLSMGTIVSEPVVKIKFQRGAFLGTAEEFVISKLKAGDTFWFAGRNLEFIKMDKMTALVKKSNKKKGMVPRWMGGRLPLSSALAQLIRQKLETSDRPEDVEVETIRPILALQRHWSAIPKQDELLVEQFESEEGHHLFVYPFCGRLVHEVMAALLAFRLSQIQPITFSFAMNDYGFELLADDEIPLQHALENGLFSTENLLFDVEQSLNKAEMAKRRFREISVIAGLVFQGYPGKNAKSKHLQASSQLLYQVFEEYDPDNLLIRQAFDEVMAMQMEQGRLEKAMQAISQQKLLLKKPPKVTPFGFPILVDRLRETLTSESIEDRVTKMQIQLEAYAEGR